MITRKDWDLTAMPDAFTETMLFRKLPEAEYHAILQGYKPRDMDDRWFMYVEKGWLYLHRSWTGHCIFKAEIAVTDGRHILTRLIINRNADQYRSTNVEADRDTFNSVLSSLITLNTNK